MQNVVSNEVFDRMIADGYTRKMIKHYFHYVNAEKSENFEDGYMEWAHEHGFIAQHAKALGVTKENYQDFVSDYDYYKTWPHNSWLRMWINDKLTLKYLFQGTPWSDLLPDYYYYSLPCESGKYALRNLVDNPYKETDIVTFLRLLCEKGTFACKPNNGTESVGFFRLSFESGDFFINGKLTDEKGIEQFVITHPNYIFTEYIVAGGGLERIHPKIHTFRVTVINEDGVNPKIVGGYIRFPVDGQGETNHQSESDLDSFAMYAAVDFKTGKYGDFIAAYPNYSMKISKHPNTGCDLTVKYQIHDWSSIVEKTLQISKYLFGTELIGFDYGITNKGLKIMEINGLPGNRGNQLSRDVYDNSEYVNYIRRKVKEIDDMPLEERIKRQNIV